ncbi:(2Fe-2S) ferredoxin [Alkalispirillum mobile]|uniref:(2Fe-2S) ferredoxin n=1 Tax=Alkalispirillum mobile TaxID=85925 RepID=A0A498BQ73_9GAMM|nr:(2Fe-2S) ferredoxin domain-containing protein [Alkalispirillum mobile]RLK46284.1 (2Fe-2S) ferredoxin [Alkalispirillum mobile]
MAYYRRHIFFCTNRREGSDRPCCCDRGGQDARAYVKARVKALGLSGPGEVRVNAAGCLDRCEEGPVAVVYPEGTWYTWVDEEDLDELVDEHLVNGREVSRLKI